MDKNNFDELLTSIQEMDQVVDGSSKASRQFNIPDPEVKALRKSNKASAKTDRSDHR